MKEELQWWVDWNKSGIKETIEKAHKAAVSFASLDPTSSMALWQIDSLAQNLQQLNERVKEYKSKIEALEIAAALTKEDK